MAVDGQKVWINCVWITVWITGSHNRAGLRTQWVIYIKLESLY